MKILSIDIGTGTQDIFLLDTRLNVENGLKMIMPSPTMIIRRRLEQAARQKQSVLLSGFTMGGGPNHWAAEDHIRQGLSVYATPEAARTFDDDLDAVREMGIQVVSEDEANTLPNSILRLHLTDLDFPAIRSSFGQFGVTLNDLDALVVGVFDHGAAPADISDRKFRFDYLDDRIRTKNRLSAFAFLPQEIPPAMTRLQSVADAARDIDVELVVMDTAPAAILGATFDPVVRQHDRVLVTNIGNLHTLAFRLGPEGIEGVFEHHTGLLTQNQLENLLVRLANGSLTNDEVFGEHGHGALIYQNSPLSLQESGCITVTGPRRSLMFASHLNPYFATPFGDMMIAGCFGLLASAADLLPELKDPIQSALNLQNKQVAAPWEIP